MEADSEGRQDEGRQHQGFLFLPFAHDVVDA